MKLLSRALRYGLAVVAVAYPVVYLAVARLRLSYPYELEWMEGAVVDHVRRVLAGQPLYVEPSMEFVPFIYTPLYYHVCAIASMLLGADLRTLRLVSLISSLGCFLVIYMFVRKETQSLLPALLSAGLFAAAYEVTGSWFDLARVDSLFLVLLLGSLYLLRFDDRPRALVLSGVLMSLAFLTKQTALLVAVAMTIHCLLVLPRWLKVVFPTTVALIVGASTFLMNRASEGWYFYYVFALPREHGLLRQELSGFWLRDINYLMVAFVLSIVSLGALALRHRRELVFHVCVLVSMIGASWLSRLHSGGYHNVLFPAYAALAIGFGLGAHALVEHKKISGTLMEPLVILLCLYQLGSLTYDPAAQLPSAEDRRAGDRFVEMLGEAPGEVFVPYHGFLSAMAGKRTYAHTMAISDVLRGRDEEVELNLRKNIEETILGGRYGMIVLDTEWGSMQDEIESLYRLRGAPFDREDVFWPVTGKRTRPELVYERRATTRSAPPAPSHQ